MLNKIIEKRKKAGRIGGLSKAKKRLVALAKQNSSKTYQTKLNETKLNDNPPNGGVDADAPTPPKEEKKTTRKATMDDRELATRLADMLLATNTMYAQKYEKIDHPELAGKIVSWAEDIEKMRRIDNVQIHQIEFVLKWLRGGKSRDALFWQGNIASGKKLREQFPKLVNCVKLEYSAVQGKAGDNRIVSV